MTPSNPTDLFKLNHQFKTQLMIDTIAQCAIQLNEKGLNFSEGAIIDIASVCWEDSLNLIQKGREPTAPIFIIDEDGDIEIG